MGANIRGAGTDVIRIVGVEKLQRQNILSSRIRSKPEIYACSSSDKGRCHRKECHPEAFRSNQCEALEIGCEVEEFDDAVRVVSSKPLHHTQVTTLPYPGFPTDMQPQIAVVLGISEGTSTVTEIFLETVLNMSVSWRAWVPTLK